MNIFLYIYGIDIALLALGYFIGYLAIEKEMKDSCKSEAWTKAHPILDWFQGFHYDIKRALEKPGEIRRGIKWFFQRGKNGYSTCDVWGFYCYLTDVIIGGLKELQKMAHGYPGGPANSMAIDTDGESEGTKEWKRIVGEIIWTFEAIKKVENHDWLLVQNEEDREEMKKFAKRLNKPERLPHTWHLMTKKECKRYKQGWKYFQEYYFNLWD